MYRVTVTWTTKLKYSFDIPRSEKLREKLEKHYKNLTWVKKVTFRKVKGS